MNQLLLTLIVVLALAGSAIAFNSFGKGYGYHGGYVPIYTSNYGYGSGYGGYGGGYGGYGGFGGYGGYGGYGSFY